MKPTPTPKPPEKPQLPPAVHDFFSACGKIGGAIGGKTSGAVKRRGGKNKAERAEYYRKLQKKGVRSKLKKKRELRRA